MKKKNFLSGMAAKLALAVVALSTVTFTSCEEEDFSIEVKINPAKVTLNTEVVYFNEEGKPSNVDATVTYDGTSNNVIMGTEAEPAIDKTVLVKAEYKGLSAEKKVKVQASANTTMTQNVTIFLVASEAKLDIVEATGKETEEKKWSTPSNGHGVSHDGAVWNENPNAFFVTVSGTYKTFNSQVIKSYELKEGANHVSAAAVANVIEGLSWNKDGQANYNYTAAAYSIFAAWYAKTTTEMTYTIVNSINKAEVAVVSAVKVSSSKISFVEKAHPNHAGHYQPGHGHGHGDASNAGGGISFAD